MFKINLVAALLLFILSPTFASDIDYIGVVEKNAADSDFKARVMFKRNIGNIFFEAMPNMPKDAAELDSIIKDYPETFVGGYFDRYLNKYLDDFEPIDSKRPLKYESRSDVGCYYDIDVKYRKSGIFLLSNTEKNRKIPFEEIKPNTSLYYFINNRIKEIFNEKQYHTRNIETQYKIENTKYEVIMDFVIVSPVSSGNDKLISFAILKKDQEYSFIFTKDNVSNVELLFAFNYGDDDKISLLFRSENNYKVFYDLYNISNKSLENFTYEKH